LTVGQAAGAGRVGSRGKLPFGPRPAPQANPTGTLCIPADPGEAKARPISDAEPGGKSGRALQIMRQFQRLNGKLT
jgi:hypothetical protein